MITVRVYDDPERINEICNSINVCGKNVPSHEFISTPMRCLEWLVKVLRGKFAFRKYKKLVITIDVE